MLMTKENGVSAKQKKLSDSKTFDDRIARACLSVRCSEHRISMAKIYCDCQEGQTRLSYPKRVVEVVTGTLHCSSQRHRVSIGRGQVGVLQSFRGRGQRLPELTSPAYWHKPHQIQL